MRKRFIVIIIIALLALSMMAFWTPNVSAATNYRIVLPFWTGWEEGAGIPIGRTNVVDYKKDFYGWYGPDNPLPPELGTRDSGDCGLITPPDGTFFGYSFGNQYLMAAGDFGASYSYCYFSLFDRTGDSDYQPPIKLKPHTYINIWYYHWKLGDCMIDAQIYNRVTKQYWTLRDFNYNGKYIVDQYNVRIHPAYRSGDPIGSWQLACFDLSIIYDESPENWYITKIWIAFDNGRDQATGQARTYFDLLHITYGVSRSMTWNSPIPSVDVVSGSIIAWEYNPAISGDQLKIKVTISGYTSRTGWYAPFTLKVSVADHPATTLSYPKPTGVGLWQYDSNWPEVDEFIMDCVTEIIEVLPYGSLFTVATLAWKFYGLLSTPSGGATYQWPNAIASDSSPNCYQYILGEVYILVSGLSQGLNTIPINFQVDYYQYTPVFFGFHWFYMWTWSLNGPLTLPFSTTPDDLYLPVKITIQAWRTTDIYSRSHGMSIDRPLPLEGDPNGPWWPPYNTGYEFKVTSQAFTYDKTVELSLGSHYVDYAASGYVPNYAWHAKIYINNVLVAEGDVGRLTRLRAYFDV